MLNQANPQQTVTEKDLKAMYAKGDLFSFRGYLARKGSPKSYVEKKKGEYRLNLIGIAGSSMLRILAAFMAVSAFLSGIFFGSDLAGTGAALIVLAGLEYLQVRNTTSLYEIWFMESRIHMPNIVYGLIFSGCTTLLAFSGVDETIRFVSETVSPFSFNEKAVNPTLLADVEKADADAKEFYTARSWKGKLDIKDAKQYNALKAAAADLRKQYRDELSTAKLNAKTDYDAHVTGTKQNEADNRFYLTLLILFTEVLFQLAFWHKERYEFFSLKELEITGQLKGQSTTQTPTGQTLPQQAANITTQPATKANGQAVPFQ